MNNPIRLTTVTLTCAFAVAACGDRENALTPPTEIATATDPAAAITTWPATRRTDQGHYDITIEPAEKNIERNRHFSVAVSVVAAGGGEVAGDGIEVSVDADMPAHRHGMNTRPEITGTGPARYRADGMLFHMSGDWVITVRVRDESATETASFPVSLE